MRENLAKNFETKSKTARFFGLKIKIIPIIVTLFALFTPTLAELIKEIIFNKPNATQYIQNNQTIINNNFNCFDQKFTPQ